MTPNEKAQSPSDFRWFQKWDALLHPEDNKVKWFSGGTSNVCFNALDKVVLDSRGEEVALAFTNGFSGKDEKYTYKEVLDMTLSFTRRLQYLGIKNGDTIMIYDPMLPQAVVAMLACARIGAKYTMVFGGATSELLAQCINNSRPTAIISSSCGLQVYFDINSAVPYKPVIDSAIEAANHKPEHVIIFQRKPISCELTGPRDVAWTDPLFDDHEHVPVVHAAVTAGLPVFMDDDVPVKPIKYKGEFGPVAEAAMAAGIPVFVPN